MAPLPHPPASRRETVTMHAVRPASQPTRPGRSRPASVAGPFLRLVALLPLSATREAGGDKAEMTFTCENSRGISPAIPREPGYEEEHLPVAPHGTPGILWARKCPGSSRASAARRPRSAQSGFGRATWRRSTASSCRNTKISRSFEASLRVSSASHANTRDMARYTRRKSTSAADRSPAQVLHTSSGTRQVITAASEWFFCLASAYVCPAGCAWGHRVLPAGLRRSGGSADSVRSCPCNGPPGCCPAQK